MSKKGMGISTGGLTLPGKALILGQIGDCLGPVGCSSYKCGQKTPWTAGCQVGPQDMAHSHGVSATSTGC